MLSRAPKRVRTNWVVQAYLLGRAPLRSLSVWHDGHPSGILGACASKGPVECSARNPTTRSSPLLSPYDVRSEMEAERHPGWAGSTYQGQRRNEVCLTPPHLCTLKMAAKHIPPPISPSVRGLIGHRRAKESVQEGS